jgi:hypothetical protein
VTGVRSGEITHLDSVVVRHGRAWVCTLCFSSAPTTRVSGEYTGYSPCHAALTVTVPTALSTWENADGLVDGRFCKSIIADRHVILGTLRILS